MKQITKEASIAIFTFILTLISQSAFAGPLDTKRLDFLEEKKLKIKISARMPQVPSTSTRHSDNRGAGEHSAKRPQGSTHSGRELCFRVE